MKRLKLVKYKKKGVRRGSGRGRKKYDKTVFLKCKECGKSHIRKSFRVGKPEWVSN